MTEPIHITVPLNPVTKKNSQRIVYAGRYARIMPSKAFCAYQTAAGAYLRPFAACIEDAVTVRCLFYMKTRRKVDLTNLLSAADDVLVHYSVLKDDESKIIKSHDGSRVLYDKTNPRTEIWIEPFES